MPNQISASRIHLNLLKPQGNPEKIYSKVMKWLLSTGRYLIVIVELLVLAAFVSRFKFDADLQSLKEQIDQQIPFIESQKNDEILIRQTQAQLSTIKNLKVSEPNYSSILKKIADQTPQNIKISNITLNKDNSKLSFKIVGSSRNNNDLANLILGLKSETEFSEINLANVGLDQSTINFTITGTATIGGQKL